MSRIKAITICQPWAWAIMHGPKRFENRPWRTEYVGPLVIHAGKSEILMPDGMRFLTGLGIAPLRSELEFGKVLGAVELVDCVRPAECGGDPFATGPYCLQLENPRRLAQPFALKGQLGLWSIEAALVAECFGDVAAQQPDETKEQRLERAIAAAGPARIKRGDQAELFPTSKRA